MTTAQRQALAARQAAAAALAARVFANDVKLAMQTVVNHLMDIPPGNWGNFAGGLNAAERAAYTRLFVHSRNPAFNGIRNGIIPGHGVCPQRLLFYNGQYRVMWWNEANERWYFAGKGVTTEFGSTGSTGYVDPFSGNSNKPLAAAPVDNDIDPNLRNTEIATNTGSNGSGLGSVAALYMSYDPRAVSRKINYITEAGTAMQPEMISGGTESTGAPLRSPPGSITPPHKPGYGVNVVSFDNWMLRLFGLDWRNRFMGGGEEVGRALNLYRAFFARYPAGTPPTNWNTQDITNQYYWAEMKRLKLMNHTFGWQPNSTIEPVTIENTALGWLWNTEDSIMYGIGNWLGRLG